MGHEYLWEVWELIIDFVDCGLAIFLFHSMLNYKYKTKIIPISFIIISAILLLLINENNFSILGILITVLVFVCYTGFFMSDSWGLKIFWPFCCLFFYNIVDLFVAEVIKLLLPNITIQSLSSDNLPRMIAMIVTRLIIAAGIILITKSRFLHNSMKPYMWAVFCIIPICSSFLVLLLFKFMLKEIPRSQITLDMFIGVLVINVLCFVLLKIIFAESDELTTANIQLKHIDMEKVQYNQAIAAYNSLRTWRHDISNHFSTIQQMLTQKNYSEALSYMKDISEQINIECALINSGNIYIDSVLNVKLQIAQKLHIKFKLDLAVPNLDYLNEYDLCSLIGNIIDNAIEASEKIEDINHREIIFKIKTYDNKVIISCNNSFKVPPSIVNRKMISSKNSSQHGFGLSIIERIVKKYEGIYNFEIGETKFLVEIILPLRIKNSEVFLFKYDQD